MDLNLRELAGSLSTANESARNGLFVEDGHIHSSGRVV